MSKPEIVGITVSIEVSNKNYGNGTASFMNLQGKYPDPATLDDVLVDGLEMYFSAWRSLLAGRYATGEMTGKELKLAVDEALPKLDKIRSFLLKKRQQVTDEQ